MGEAELAAFVSQQETELVSSKETLGITQVERVGLEIFVRFHLVREGQDFLMRCSYRPDSTFPVPSITFVNPVTKAAEGAANWPKDPTGAVKGANSPPFVCLPGVYEYHFQYHGGVVPTRRNLSLVNTLADIMGNLNR